jgi:hypothetical protein
MQQEEIPMPGALPHYRSGPDSYQVSAAVAGGTLVIADGTTTTTVSTAGAGAINVLGVAGNDAQPVPNQASATDSLAGGAPLLDISVVGDYVAVYHGVDIAVTYAATAAFGQLLKSAAAGQVTPWVSGTDTLPATIVGRCTQPGGVASAPLKARARIF